MSYELTYIYADYIHKGSKFFAMEVDVDYMPNHTGTMIYMSHQDSHRGALDSLWDFVQKERKSIMGSPLLFEKVGYPFAGKIRLVNGDNSITIHLENCLLTQYTRTFPVKTGWLFTDINYTWTRL